MMASLKSALLLTLLLLGIHGIRAQSPTQVIIANGGTGDSLNWVRVGAWNLATGSYTIFDSLPASSAQHVFIWGRDAYVCADSLLVRYNIDSYQREAIATIPGLRQVAVWEDKVLVSKGLGAVNDHFEVRYAENLFHCFSEPAISGNCQGVVVVGDTGYVANPVTFLNPTGNMAVVDLRSRVLDRIMDMDTSGKFIDRLFVHQGKVVSINIVRFNNPQWGFISLYDIANGAFTHHKVNVPVSQGAGIDNGLLYANFDGNVGSFDLASGQLANPVVVPGTWAGMVLDSVNDRLYLSRTDYQTYGWVHTFDYNGNELDSVEVNISPVAMAIDYNVAVGNQPVTVANQKIGVYPQPFGDQLHVDFGRLGNPVQSLVLYDLLGHPLYRQTVHGQSSLALDLPDLQPGAYILEVQTRSGVATVKVIKAQR